MQRCPTPQNGHQTPQTDEQHWLCTYSSRCRVHPATSPQFWRPSGRLWLRESISTNAALWGRSIHSSPAVINTLKDSFIHVLYPLRQTAQTADGEQWKTLREIHKKEGCKVLKNTSFDKSVQEVILAKVNPFSRFRTLEHTFVNFSSFWGQT